MKGKSAIVFSLFLGVIAVAIVSVYLNNERNKIFEDSKPIKVLVAKRDILEMERLSQDMVEVQEVPQKFKQPKAITSLEQLIGQVTAVPISKGEQIVETKLVAYGYQTGLSMKIPPGMRALAIPVNDVTGVAGLVKPGNYVDIYGTFKVKSKKGNEVFEATRLILQKVQVLSIEREMGAITREKKEEDEENLKGVKSTVGLTKQQQYPKNMTVAVTPSQAARVITAVAAGLVTVTLRSRYETEEEVGVKGLDVRDLIGKDQVVPAKRRPDWVEIRGSERTFE